MNRAQRAMQRAIQEDPSCARAWWVRSLLREWARDFNGSDRAMTHAAWLDPEGYPLPPQLDTERLQVLLSKAIANCDEDVQAYLETATRAFEECPGEELLSGYEPPMSPLQLLCHFRGPRMITDGYQPLRFDGGAWSQIPAHLILFRRNLQRMALDPEQCRTHLTWALTQEVRPYIDNS